MSNQNMSLYQYLIDGFREAASIDPNQAKAILASLQETVSVVEGLDDGREVFAIAKNLIGEGEVFRPILQSVEESIQSGNSASKLDFA